MPLKVSELEQLELEELKKRLEDLQLQQVKLRAQAKMGSLKETSSIRNVRKDIARLKMVMERKGGKK
jgi:large subunit ribosomal protein L29